MRSKSSMRGGAVILAASARGTCGVWPQANVCTIDHWLAAKRLSVVLDLVHTMHCDAQRQEQLQCRSACQPTTGGGGGLCRRICAAWPGEAVHVGVCEHADYSGAVRARQGETRVTQSPDPARTHLLDMASLTRERLFYNSLESARKSGFSASRKALPREKNSVTLPLLEVRGFQCVTKSWCTAKEHADRGARWALRVTGFSASPPRSPPRQLSPPAFLAGLPSPAFRRRPSVATRQPSVASRPLPAFHRQSHP